MEVNSSSSQEIEEQAAALEEELNEMEQQAAELGEESLFQDTDQESLEQWKLELAQHEQEHGGGWRSMIGELSSSWNPELREAATADRQTALAAAFAAAATTTADGEDAELMQAETPSRQELLLQETLELAESMPQMNLIDMNGLDDLDSDGESVAEHPAKDFQVFLGGGLEPGGVGGINVEIGR